MQLHRSAGGSAETRLPATNCKNQAPSAKSTAAFPAGEVSSLERRHLCLRFTGIPAGSCINQKRKQRCLRPADKDIGDPTGISGRRSFMVVTEPLAVASG